MESLHLLLSTGFSSGIGSLNTNEGGKGGGIQFTMYTGGEPDHIFAKLWGSFHCNLRVVDCFSCNLNFI